MRGNHRGRFRGWDILTQCNSVISERMWRLEELFLRGILLLDSRRGEIRLWLFR